MRQAFYSVSEKLYQTAQDAAGPAGPEGGQGPAGGTGADQGSGTYEADFETEDGTDNQ